MSESDLITELLQRWQTGDKTAQEELFQLVYRELRRIAGARLRNEMRAGQMLQATELVHEIYPQLARQRAPWQNRSHFYAIASECMRRYLIDVARNRSRQKRGGDIIRISLSDLRPSEICRIENDDEVIAVDRSIEKLSEIDETAAIIIKHRYFGGLSREEIAEVLEVSPSTVDRTYRFAKAWLKRELAFQFSPYLLSLGQINNPAEFIRKMKAVRTDSGDSHGRENLPEDLLKKIDAFDETNQNPLEILPEIIAELNKSLLNGFSKTGRNEKISAAETEMMPVLDIRNNRRHLEETFAGQFTKMF